MSSAPEPDGDPEFLSALIHRRRLRRERRTRHLVLGFGCVAALALIGVAVGLVRLGNRQRPSDPVGIDVAGRVAEPLSAGDKVIFDKSIPVVILAADLEAFRVVYEHMSIVERGGEKTFAVELWEQSRLLMIEPGSEAVATGESGIERVRHGQMMSVTWVKVRYGGRVWYAPKQFFDKK